MATTKYSGVKMAAVTVATVASLALAFFLGRKAYRYYKHRRESNENGGGFAVFIGQSCHDNGDNDDDADDDNNMDTL